MNINPISFGKVIRVEGNEPKKTAKQIKNFVKEEINGIAVVESFSKNSAYVATGLDALDLIELRKDTQKAIKAAIANFGADSLMTQLVKESEADRYKDLAKCVLAEGETIVIDTTFDNDKNKIQSIYILG